MLIQECVLLVKIFTMFYIQFFVGAKLRIENSVDYTNDIIEKGN